LLAGVQEVLSHTLGAEVSVHVKVEAAIPPLLADRSQLEIVLVNLAVNARDAMAPLGGGTLALSATIDDVSSKPDHIAGVRPGKYVRIEIADTGSGMDATTLARAAEPFFTTKPQGKGTGLGLAMAKGFAEQSGGALRIRSELGHGTTVTLWLPRAETVAVAADALSEVGEAVAFAVAGCAGLRLLLVDDQPLVRAVLAEELRARDFVVEEADGGLAALTRLDAGETFHLLVTDLSMPGMNGLELIQSVRARRPDLPAVLLTGYADETSAGAIPEGDPWLVLLRKPVAADELASRAAALLHIRNATEAA
jgi:CheY-like chemotaxis protein